MESLFSMPLPSRTLTSHVLTLNSAERGTRFQSQGGKMFADVQTELWQVLMPSVSELRAMTVLERYVPSNTIYPIRSATSVPT
jgi:hypothetical protein